MSQHKIAPTNGAAGAASHVPHLRALAEAIRHSTVTDVATVTAAEKLAEGFQALDQSLCRAEPLPDDWKRTDVYAQAMGYAWARDDAAGGAVEGMDPKEFARMYSALPAVDRLRLGLRRAHANWKRSAGQAVTS